MTHPQTDASLFGAYYFKHDCGQPYERNETWLKFFAGIAETIRRTIAPRTVLDAGCAMGFLVEALRERGVEAWGVDVSEYAIERVHPDIRQYCSVGSVTAPSVRTYDLIVCVEVLEHLSTREAEKAIENFCRCSKDVLFSSTPFDYKEVTHWNVRPPEYWAELFARQGFYRDIDFDASFITPWAVRVRRSREPWPRVVRAYERKFSLLWKENTDLRGRSMEMHDELENKEKELIAKDVQLAERHQQLMEIEGSETWKLAWKLQRLRKWLVPLGSWRERWLLHR